jgi:hypothetical protein
MTMNSLKGHLLIASPDMPDPEHVACKMIDEAAGRAIRLAGTGDILPKHKALPAMLLIGVGRV